MIAQNTHLYLLGNDTEMSLLFPTNDRILRYRQINSSFFTDKFYLTARRISSRGKKCAQIFVSDMFPMKSKENLFCKGIRVSISLVVEPSGEQTKIMQRDFFIKLESRHVCRKNQISGKIGQNSILECLRSLYIMT